MGSGASKEDVVAMASSEANFFPPLGQPNPVSTKGGVVGVRDQSNIWVLSGYFEYCRLDVSVDHV